MGLFFGGAGNHQVALVDFHNRRVDGVQRQARAFGYVERRFGALGAVAHRVHGLFGAALNAANHAFNFAGRLLRAMCQCPHFVRHDRKPAARFTGTRRFDGRVQGQQVGLIGQAANHIQHFANVPRLSGQVANQGRGALHIATHAFDGADSFQYQVAAITGRGGGIFRGFGGADGVTCHFFYGTGHFVDGRCGLLDLVVLLGQAFGAFVRDAVQLFSRRRQLRGRARNPLQGVTQLALHLGHGLQQTTGFIAAIDLDRASEVAFGNRFGRLKRLRDGLSDAAGQEQGAGDGQRSGQ